MRTAIAIGLGFVIWFVVGLATMMIATFFWGWSVDSVVALMISSFIGTTLSLILAEAAILKISPSVNMRKSIFVLSGLILLWVASSLIDGVDFQFRLASFGGHFIACAIATIRA